MVPGAYAISPSTCSSCMRCSICDLPPLPPSRRHHALVAVEAADADVGELESRAGGNGGKPFVRLHVDAAQRRTADHHDGRLAGLEHTVHLREHRGHLPEVATERGGLVLVHIA